MSESRTTERTMRIQFPDGREIVVVTISILCPTCGDIEFIVPGEHVRTVLDILTNVRDRYPTLCGEVGTVVDTFSVVGKSPSLDKIRSN